MASGRPDLHRLRLLLDGDGQSGPTNVPVLRLDDIVGDRSARGAKIDVEGAERPVLEGASSALKDGRIDVLQLESNSCRITAR
jgi:FkbM family methyltransferase